MEEFNDAIKNGIQEPMNAASITATTIVSTMTTVTADNGTDITQIATEFVDDADQHISTHDTFTTLEKASYMPTIPEQDNEYIKNDSLEPSQKEFEHMVELHPYNHELEQFIETNPDETVDEIKRKITPKTNLAEEATNTSVDEERAVEESESTEEKEVEAAREEHEQIPVEEERMEINDDITQNITSKTEPTEEVTENDADEEKVVEESESNKEVEAVQVEHELAQVENENILVEEEKMEIVHETAQNITTEPSLTDDITKTGACEEEVVEESDSKKEVEAVEVEHEQQLVEEEKGEKEEEKAEVEGKEEEGRKKEDEKETEQEQEEEENDEEEEKEEPEPKPDDGDESKLDDVEAEPVEETTPRSTRPKRQARSLAKPSPQQLKVKPEPKRPSKRSLAKELVEEDKPLEPVEKTIKPARATSSRISATITSTPVPQKVTATASSRPMAMASQKRGKANNYDEDGIKKFVCHDCDYSTDRLNNIVYHKKSGCKAFQSYWNQSVESYKKDLIKSPKSNKKRYTR